MYEKDCGEFRGLGLSDSREGWWRVSTHSGVEVGHETTDGEDQVGLLDGRSDGGERVGTNY